MASMIEGLVALGFAECATAEHEEGFEKIAIFGLGDDEPTHLCRQISAGLWTSKLGANLDISHELHAVEGAFYGIPRVFMKRPKDAADMPVL